MHARRVRKQIRGTASLRVDTGVIGDQADVLVPQRRKFLRFENVEAGLHAAWAAGLFPAGARRSTQRRSEEQAGRDASCVRSPFRFARETKGLHSAATNDIVELNLWSCIVHVMCVCYIQTLHPA
jgi:hypothetical protein